MKLVRLLILLAAFLIMVSSVFSLMASTDRTAIYINIAAMFSLAVAISVMNFKSKPKDNI